MKSITYIPRGVCARKIIVTVDDGKVVDVVFEGGCDGNHTGIERLVRGRSVAEVAGLLEGTTCGARRTSCPDQLSKALRQLL
ncbi:MAG: TIGR03905 family TSCPD domain-containing protein [Sphaerochaetaceae bacterium]